MMMVAFVSSITGMEILLKACDQIEATDSDNTYGIAEILGLRPTMEDETDVQINDDHAFFGVYDGHNGKTVATIAKYNLHKMCQLHRANTDDEIKAVLRNGFLMIQQNLSHQVWYVGSTATVAVIKNRKIFVANAGDSRTVLCSNGNAIPLSEDHKAAREDEEQRIVKAGGHIKKVEGSCRVNGVLAVTRALGDKYLYPHVIADPDITVRDLSPQDEFLILASDGVWDVMKDQDAVNHVKGTLSYDYDCTRAARLLACDALRKKSTDNISAIVVNLKAFTQK